MSQKKLIPFINAENEMPGSVISLADRYACEGADGLYLYNFTGDEKSREEFLATVRQIEKKIDFRLTKIFKRSQTVFQKTSLRWKWICVLTL